MDINSVSNLGGAQPSDDSAAERARRDERASREAGGARFKSAMERRGDPTAPINKPPVIVIGKDGKPVVAGANTNAGAANEPALSPAMMKLQSKAGGAAQGAGASAGKPGAPAGPEAKGGPTAGVADGAAANSQAGRAAARFGGGMMNPAMMQVLAQQASAELEFTGAAPTSEAARHDARIAAQAGDDVSERQAINEAHSVEESETAGASDGAGALSAQATPLAGANVPVAPTAGPATTLPMELLQQVIDYATVSRNTEGFMEFRMGLSRDTLGGMRVRVTAFGNRRVGLKIQNGDTDAGVSEGEVAGLIAALKARNVDVVEVAVE